ncbi:MAG: DivIVA domain-containing protein [Candidatus Eisenbacteria bacterium]|nr:DivIVA domain-containing protein [Candidatus Latescibacterota bacterium]MBD3301914.1 DivIVA domain-containing protein [Candidatus Eisenbacteria bacterium]
MISWRRAVNSPRASGKPFCLSAMCWLNVRVPTPDGPAIVTSLRFARSISKLPNRPKSSTRFALPVLGAVPIVSGLGNPAWPGSDRSPRLGRAFRDGSAVRDRNRTPQQRRRALKKISPLDIRKQTFRSAFRGVDKEEVRVFLDLIATEYESVLQENLQLTDRLQHCEDRLVEYRELDQTLRNSLLTAERLTEEAKTASKREANQILQDADWRAKQMLDDARERLGRLTEEIRALQSKKEAFTQHLRSFLHTQLELLDRNEQYLGGIDRLSDETQAVSERIRNAEAPAPPPRRAAEAGHAGLGESRTEGPTEEPPARMRDDDLPDSIPPEESQGFPEPRWREEEPPARGPAPDRRAERSEGLFEISAEEDDGPPREDR